MTRIPSTTHQLLTTLCAFALLLAPASAQCNTDQNPYCRGNNEFEQLCCPYPSVCYWADRQGTPACCAAGQVCLDGGGGYVTPPVSQPLSTITSYVSNPPPETQPNGGGAAGGGAVVITTTENPYCDTCKTITSYAGGAVATVTSEVAGAFSTLTSNVAGAFETVTSTIGAVATEAASDIVQVINGKGSTAQVCLLYLLAAVLCGGLWVWI